MKQGSRDFFLYVLIGIVLVTIVTTWEFLIPEKYWVHISYTWYSFIFFSVVLAIVLVKMYWPVRRSLKIWVLLALFFAAHVAFFTFFLHYVQQWPGFWYLVTMPIEVMVVAALVYKCLHVLPPKVKL